MSIDGRSTRRNGSSNNAGESAAEHEPFLCTSRRLWLEWSCYQERLLNAWVTRAVFVSVLMSLVAGVATLRGTAQTAPALTIAPTKLDFGARPVGSPSDAQTITLTNGGASPLAMDEILTSGFDFSQTNSCGANLDPGTSCTVQVIFKPATTGPRLGTLTVLATGSGGPHLVPISGVGQ